jgi:hypothetical protein
MENLEHRVLLTSLSAANLPAKHASYSAATVPALIADINAANQRGGTNIITLTAPISSPYVLTAVEGIVDGPTGLPLIGGGKKADNLTIIGNGDTIEGSINGAQMRLLEVASNGSLTLKNVTLTGGNSTVEGDLGGAAVCNLGTLVLDAVNVTGNEMTGVAGIEDAFGDMLSSSYPALGGGVWSSGSLTVQDGTVFSNNVAMGAVATNSGPTYYDFPSGAMGGAIYIAGGSATISNTTITGNQAVTPEGSVELTTGGGGIYFAGGNVTIINTAITGNETIASGGYLEITGGAGIYINGGNATISNTTITGNEAVAPQDYETTGGGGIYVAGGDVTITNTTITGNEAVAPQGDLTTTNWGGGGGIFIAGGTVYLDTFTVANTIENLSTDAGGADIVGSFMLLA